MPNDAETADPNSRPTSRSPYKKIKANAQLWLLSLRRPAGGEEKPQELKAKARILVGADEAVVIGDGLDKVKSAKFKGKDIKFRPSSKSVVLLKLVGAGVTSTAGEQEVEFEFENGTKAKVTIDTVNSKIEVVDHNSN